MAQTFTKDSNAILDYQINWATWLGTDTIATSTWTVPTGITKVSDTNTTTTTTIWLSGGTDGASYSLVNRITTAAGRTEDDFIVIYAKDTARAGLGNMISRLRRMVNDDSASAWNDNELQELLDQHRIDIWDHELRGLAFNTSGGTTVYTTYLAGWRDLEEAGSGTAAWRLVAADGTVIGTANYTVDYINGVVTFTVDQAGSARYLDCRSFDLAGAAAQAWREAAGGKASYYTFSVDGQGLNRSDWFKHCMQMADYYDRKTRPLQIPLMRNDLN